MPLFRTTLPVALFRLTRGRVFGGVLLLETTGRRSGRPRTTPVQFQREGDAFVIVAANAGSARPPAWLFNLRAQPDVRVQVRGETREVTAREARGEEREALWARLTRANPALAKAQERAGRELPVLVLAPRASGGAG